MESECTHHASGPAVHHFRQAKFELANKLLRRLSYPTIPLQLSDTLGHRQHSVDALEEKNETQKRRKRFRNISEGHFNFFTSSPRLHRSPLFPLAVLPCL